MCNWGSYDGVPVLKEELVKALSKLNRGKAADIMRMTAEYLLFSEDSAIDIQLVILNEILHKGSITDSMRIGLLTPVLKKGSKLVSKNYKELYCNPYCDQDPRAHIAGTYHTCNSGTSEWPSERVYRAFLSVECSPGTRGVC